MRAYRGPIKLDITVGYDILATLAKHFKTSVPLLEFIPTAAKRTGVYYRSHELIQLHIPADWINTLLHEYAHHLNGVRNYNGHGHGKDFAELLYRVVHFYYNGDIHRYTWESEYKSLRRIPFKMAIREKRLRDKLKRLEKELERLT